MLTSSHEDDIGLGITAVDDVASLGDTLLGGSRKVGDRLTGQGQDGGAGVPLHVHALAVLNCNLQPIRGVWRQDLIEITRGKAARMQR